MSTLKKVISQKNHHERSQLGGRAHLGLLEKKKDYVLRSKDYHSKQNRLKAMKEKASLKNPDEFYFGMVGKTIRDGKHYIGKGDGGRGATYTHEALTAMKTQDQNYINFVRSVNKAKVDRLATSLHWLESKDPAPASGPVNEDEDGDEDEDEGKGDGPATGSNHTPNHTVFLDSKSQVEKFSPAKHFDCPPALLSRKFNRPTSALIATAPTPRPPSRVALKERRALVRELQDRLQRELVLKKAARDVDLEKEVMGKGAKRKVTTKAGHKVWKWKNERKK